MRIGPVVALIAAIVCAAPLAAQEAATLEPPAPDLKDFQLVFLYTDEEYEADEEDLGADSPVRAARVQRGRQFHLEQLLRSGSALIGGDILDGVSLKAAVVLDLDDTRQVQQLFDESPGVQHGKLKAETFVWWAADGILQPPTEPEDLITIWLGLFERPPSPPSFPPEELERLQAGHLENIESMAKTGDLVIAGPVENGGDLRGILIFRTENKERIEQLVSADPLVKAGRLVFELYRWKVPRSSVPAPS